LKELVEKLMTEIMEKHTDVKDSVDSESDDEMPSLMEDIERDIPPLTDSDSDKGWTENPEIDEDLMIAVFKRPSCSRCEAALKILLSDEEEKEESTTSSTPSETPSESSSESSEEPDNSDDSDYVPSEELSEDSSSESESASDSEPPSPRTLQRRAVVIPSEIVYVFIAFIVVCILRLTMLVPNQPIPYRYRSCY